MEDPQSVDTSNVTITCASIVDVAYIDGSFQIAAGQVGSPPPNFQPLPGGISSFVIQ
jgi:hypothetical protein